MTRRPHVSLKVKLASALLQMMRVDEAGKFVPVISYEESKGMTADEIIGRFDFDHGVYHVFGGPAEPWNFTPRIRPDHRVKTAKIDIPAIAKTKRLTKSEQAFRERLLAKQGGETAADNHPKRKRPWPKRKIRRTP